MLVCGAMCGQSAVKAWLAGGGFSDFAFGCQVRWWEGVWGCGWGWGWGWEWEWM